MPPGVVTVTSTVPATLGGEVAVIWVAESTGELVAGVAPKSTAVAPVKPVPVMVTVVPPAVGPEPGADRGDRRRRVVGELVSGAGGEVPPGRGDGHVDGARRVPAGEVAVIWVSESTVKVVAGVVPKSTAVAPVKPVPVMVTEVPPAVGPEPGATEVTVGAAT